MGSELSRSLRAWSSRNHRRILLVGLDSAGKTTFMNQLIQSQAGATVPTVEFNTKILSYKKWKLYITDVGGQDNLRPFWRHHFTGTQGIVFVMDSVDVERMRMASKELRTLLQDDQLREIPVLVFVNKQDMIGAMKVDDVRNGLNLSQLPEVAKLTIKFQAGSAKNGDGVFESIDWICNHASRV